MAAFLILRHSLSGERERVRGKRGILLRSPKRLSAGSECGKSECERGNERMKKWFIVVGALGFLSILGCFVLTFYAVKFIQPYVQKVTVQGLTLTETRAKT